MKKYGRTCTDLRPFIASKGQYISSTIENSKNAVVAVSVETATAFVSYVHAEYAALFLM